MTRRVALRVALLVVGAVGLLVGLTAYFSSEKIPPCLVAGAPKWRPPTDRGRHRFLLVVPDRALCFYAIDDDHILVEGRVPAPLVTWNSHAGWPGGAQWLFERRGSAFVEVARRQTRDPEYVASGFIGGLIARDASAMARFATPSAVAAALSLPGPARYNGAVGVFGGPGLIDRERMSWTALPASVRADPPAGPAWGPLPVFEGPPELADMVLRFDRRNDGWVITEVAMRPVPAAGEAFLVPD